ncbi:trafficking protein particle complex subunit 10 [Pectinophora gossypiella]|nr:trafficking protein particle complex subunit 10 [Pectinophora gossypiella]XP_049885563.1 trafficking protein particle complex subunit 10 [Pectinophora gossypiella]XP_049885564.1 trafficking protein particle complex subunit 10 [Pectinophora gossypiella]XP_049885565.1 trafficking protein particle complex subunit 10 [Pectinophora gossypiella]
MKGVDNSPSDREGMTNKPIVTCAGDWNLFCTLEAPLVAAIPQDSCEWRRSYGRVTKSVYLEASFVKYNRDKLQSEYSLLKRPIFHIYWTDCVDIEYYKTTLREDVESWLKHLEKNGVTDWMIILVETYDIRKTNKLLPRTTVLDKIKGDFAVKQTEDRFISVINPIKSEARSAESWRSLVAKMRHLILVAYNKALIKFEEYTREQREKRNDPEWDFCKYFILQEQLAFVLEMLGLYDEALVQYDELDALFSQFVLNSNVTASPKWLDSFRQPITSWQAVKLTALVPQKLRDLIIKKKASLLDFRSYLFQRQSAMLLLTNKPWEIASRCLATVHSTLVELNLLGASAVEGAAACWAQLACAETLRAIEKLSASNSALEMCTATQAPLLHNAKDKLHELGKLCGLLPGSPDPTSEQLHLVVMLSAGMGDSEPNNQQPTPTDRLKEALCSKTCFQQYYLELAELAMGTYKHIGRLRFARLIGRDLAAFYSELGETGKAVVFLMDALRSYEEQGWWDLAAQTRLELVAAAKKMNDMDRYTKLSATIACTAELEILVRNFYFEEMMKSIKDNLLDKSDTVLAELNDCFKIVSATLIPSERGVYITDSTVQCCLVVDSNFPKEVSCSRAAINIEKCKDAKQEKRTPMKSYKTDLSVSVGVQTGSPKKPTSYSDCDSANLISSIRLDDLKPKNPLLSPLQITSQLHYKEDKTLQKATLECQNPKVTLKRSDSSKYRKPSATVRNDYQHSFSADNLILKPGINEINLEYPAKTCGTFKLGQVSLLVEKKLEFLSNVLIPIKVGYEVVTQGVNVYLNKVEPKKDLVAGLEHAMELVVTSGSSPLQENSTILLKTSTGLLIRFADNPEGQMSRELSIPVPASKPFESTRVPLRLFASLQPKREKSIEHTVWLNCPWWDTVTEVPLHFSPPIVAAWRLLTSNTRKFVHVTLKSSVAHFLQFRLTNPKLDCDNNTTVSDLNPKNAKEMMLASDGTTASFMWELQKDPLVKAGPMKATFSIDYTPVGIEEPSRTFNCPFDIQDYTTLFVIRTKLEPSKGSDFCRASQMCCLQLSVQRVNETEYTSLMYEVLADQSMWAVLGRTAGVITMESECTEPQCVTLDVMPLVAGYLPLPTVRLSKYIAASAKDLKKENTGHPRLEPFSPGQVYHAGKAKQVHVLPPAPKEHVDPSA